jgi:predicted NUDIX family NTP pyrophosphohydrolase
MSKFSAGILLWKRDSGTIRVLLVHPGGPFWRNKDAGAWSIPKGEYGAGENKLAAARREFAEELGILAHGVVTELGDIKQKAGKVVTGFAIEADFDVSALRSNACEIEWPPRSGKRVTFPEVDRAEWFTLNEARAKINPAQTAFLDRLAMSNG